MTQNKNVPKFTARLFHKYHKNFDESAKRSSRINQVNEVFESFQSQGKIQLSFFTLLFKDSRFNKINRKILY